MPRLASVFIGIAALAAALVSRTPAAEVTGDDLHKILEALQRIEGRLEALEKAVKTAGGAPESRAAALPDPPPGRATVKVGWEYRDFHGKIETYEAPPGAKLWATKIYKAGERVPIGPRVKDEVLFLEPGKPRLVVLVYRNPMPRPQTFYVIPHVADPATHTVDLDYKCACTGERYKVPPGATWARVIEYKVSPNVKPGEKIDTWMVAVGEH
jgi:hypothetical protein